MSEDLKWYMEEEELPGMSEVSAENNNESDFNFDEGSLGVCPNCGANVLYGKYGAYCEAKCGMTIARLYGHTFTEAEIKSILKGDDTLIKGLKSKSGKAYNANVTPEEIEDYEFSRDDGTIFSGKRYKFLVQSVEK